MNKKIQSRINETLRQVRRSDHAHLSCIRLNPTCSDAHNDEIIRRCKEYLKTGTLFLTEVTFLNGQRADILLPSINPPIIEEIMVSETDEMLEAKNYPFPIKRIKVGGQNDRR